MNIFRFSNYLTPSGLASVAISNKQTNFDIPLCAINIVSVFIQLLTLCKLANSSFFPPPSKVHQGNTSLCTYRYLHGSASQLGSVSLSSQLRGKSQVSLHLLLYIQQGTWTRSSGNSKSLPLKQTTGLLKHIEHMPVIEHIPKSETTR